MASEPYWNFHIGCLALQHASCDIYQQKCTLCTIRLHLVPSSKATPESFRNVRALLFLPHFVFLHHLHSFCLLRICLFVDDKDNCQQEQDTEHTTNNDRRNCAARKAAVMPWTASWARKRCTALLCQICAECGWNRGEVQVTCISAERLIWGHRQTLQRPACLVAAAACDRAWRPLCGKILPGRCVR